VGEIENANALERLCHNVFSLDLPSSPRAGIGLSPSFQSGLLDSPPARGMTPPMG
jgi:hypothetical protein